MLVVLREGDQVKEVRAEQARLNREYGLVSRLLKARGPAHLLQPGAGGHPAGT